MKPRPERKIEFIAKTITDLGKGIFVVGIASYFFERFPLWLRVAVGALSVILVFGGILIYPEGGEEE